MFYPKVEDIDRAIEIALIEDIGSGDITTNSLVDIEHHCKFEINAREELVLCGVEIACRVFEKFEQEIRKRICIPDGRQVKAGETLISGEGNTRAVMAAERVALNVIQHLSGIATETAKYVAAVEGTQAKILDTRKTIPGLRVLQKYAVAMGGGQNHRFGLDDGILIKDNHIAVVGSLTEAVKRAKNNPKNLTHVEVECDRLDQVEEALEAGADIILLDNMSLEMLREAVKMSDGKAVLEASGGVNLETVADIAATGVDYISVGALTHSVRAADVGLDIN